MAELFTFIALAADAILAAAFAKSISLATTNAAAHEQSSDLDSFEGRAVVRIPTRNARNKVLRDIGESTTAYRGWPIF
jgi:hypothetical protein